MTIIHYNEQINTYGVEWPWVDASMAGVDDWEWGPNLEGGELGVGSCLGLSIGVLGRHGDGISRRLEAVLVGGPVDDDVDVVAVLVLGGEAVAAALHVALLLADLFVLAADVLRRRVGGLVGVLEAAVLVLGGLHAEDAVIGQGLVLLGPGDGHGHEGGEQQLPGGHAVRGGSTRLRHGRERVPGQGGQHWEKPNELRS